MANPPTVIATVEDDHRTLARIAHRWCQHGRRGRGWTVLGDGRHDGGGIVGRHDDRPDGLVDGGGGSPEARRLDVLRDRVLTVAG